MTEIDSIEELDRARLERLEALHEGKTAEKFRQLGLAMTDEEWDALWTVGGRLAVVARCEGCGGPATDEHELGHPVHWHRFDCATFRAEIEAMPEVEDWGPDPAQLRFDELMQDIGLNSYEEKGDWAA